MKEIINRNNSAPHVYVIVSFGLSSIFRIEDIILRRIGKTYVVYMCYL